MKNDDDDVKKIFLVFLGELLKKILLSFGNYEKIKNFVHPKIQGNYCFPHDQIRSEEILQIISFLSQY